MRDRTPIQRAAVVVGLTFLAVGIAGFVPGVTTNLYDGLELAGHEGNAELLGLFQISVLHNVVHLLYGVAGLALAASASGARTYLVGGGALYLVLWIYGMVIDKTSDANFVPFNRADDWLHFGLGVGMIALGLIFSRDRDRTTAVEPRRTS